MRRQTASSSFATKLAHLLDPNDNRNTNLSDFLKKEREYWWLGNALQCTTCKRKDIAHFVATCESWQMHSNVRHRDELYPIYHFVEYFQWMVDLVVMPMAVGQMKFLGAFLGKIS